MINESERKFLVSPSIVTSGVLNGLDYRLVEQGYFTKEGPAVRICVSSRPYLTSLHDVAKFCVKGPSTLENGYLVRPEFEYQVPADEGRRMLALAPTYLRKHRWELPAGWEIDMVELHSQNGGLVSLWVAEFELDGKRVFPETLPSWVIKEVTQDDQYSMRNLAWRWGRKDKMDQGRPLPIPTPMPTAGEDR